MTMTERIALVLLVAATPLAAQFNVPEQGYHYQYDGDFTDAQRQRLKPKEEQVNFGNKPRKDSIANGVQGDLSEPGDDDGPVVYDPVTDAVAIGHMLTWDDPVEVTCFTTVGGKVGGDIKNGRGFGAAAANVEAKCQYGGIEVTSSDEKSLAITTQDTTLIAGMQITVFGYTTTVFADSGQRQELPLADSDIGPEKCTNRVAISFQANGYASMTLWRPAVGEFYYEAKGGALVSISGFCQFHGPDADGDQQE